MYNGYFRSITRHGIMTNRKFWATIRPFLINKGMIASNEISLKQGDDVINNEGKVAEFLKNGYINVVENTAGKKPLSLFYVFFVLIWRVIALYKNIQSN